MLGVGPLHAIWPEIDTWGSLPQTKAGELSGRGGGAGHHVVFSFIRLSLSHTSRRAHKHTPPQTGRFWKCEGMSMYLLRIRHVVRGDLKWQKQEQKQMPKTNAIRPGIQCLGLGFIIYIFGRVCGKFGLFYFRTFPTTFQSQKILMASANACNLAANLECVRSGWTEQ